MKDQCNIILGLTLLTFIASSYVFKKYQVLFYYDR
jgi:hypothetical protein